MADLDTLLADTPDKEIPKDKLDTIVKAVAKLRDLELEIAEREENQKDAKRKLLELKHRTIPDLLDEAGTDRIGLPASGNMAGFDAVMVPYYKANIAADWDLERRNRAFNWIIDDGHQDLLKHTFTITFGLKEEADAREFAKLLKAEGVGYEVSMSVPWTTLTAFVKEQIETYGRSLPLETLGAQVSRIVELRKRKT